MNTTIKYTLAFLLKDQKVLMIWRNKEPWSGYWNGLGGKLEPNEISEESVIREVLEEAEIDIKKSKIQYKGVFSWTSPLVQNKLGMHVFIVKLPKNFKTWTVAKNTKEGILSWLDLDTVLSNKNNDIALNVPHFLKPMLETNQEKEYYFIFKSNEDFKMEII